VLERRVRRALRWVMANHAAYAIRVVNLSLGGRVGRCGVRSPFAGELEALYRQGVLATVSAGNWSARGGCGINS
jgi:hypothetical protein